MYLRYIPVLIYAALALLLVVLKWPELHDPHYWDALGCYVRQARFISVHGLDLTAYHELEFVRPPLFTSALAGLMVLGGKAPFALHLMTCLWGALALPATYVITRALGGTRLAAALAVVFLMMSPLYFAQVGLVQSDVPATTLCAWAWALLLSGGRGRVALAVGLQCLAVLTKESAYFLCLPMAVLLCLRAAGPLPRRLLAAWPAVIPGAVLLGWEAVHFRVMGYVVPPVYAAAIAPGFLSNALLHNFLEGGRWALLPLACVGAWRGTAGTQKREIAATALAVVALPFAFPAPLPRYMLPSLPFLCALAGLGLLALRTPAQRIALSVVLAGVLLAGMYAPGWDGRGGGHHMDQSLAYRTVLAAEEQAAQALAQVGARRVLASFPMYFVLSEPPENGFLERPIAATAPSDELTLPVLCQHDYLVAATQQVAFAGVMARLQAAGALTLWRSFGPADRQVRVYRVACPTVAP